MSPSQPPNYLKLVGDEGVAPPEVPLLVPEKWRSKDIVPAYLGYTITQHYLIFVLLVRYGSWCVGSKFSSKEQ